MAPQNITTLQQAARATSRIGVLLGRTGGRIDDQIERLKARLTELQARKAAVSEATDAEAERLALGLYRFYEAHRGIDGTPVDVTTGTLGIEERRQGATEKLAGDKEIAQEIQRLRPDLFGEIVTIRYAVDLSALKRHQDLLDQMVTVSVPKIRAFVVKPKDSRKSFRRPLGWILKHLNQTSRDVA